jgi:hypothetical protein
VTLSGCQRATFNIDLSNRGSRHGHIALRHGQTLSRCKSIEGKVGIAYFWPQKQGNDMTEMIERVARRLCDENGGNPDDVTDRGWEAFVGSARAAIEAMREPTEAMKTAASGYRIEEASSGYDARPVDVWQDMIHAALGPVATINGAKHVYTLQSGEDWRLLPDGSLVVVHPEHPPFIVHADGTKESIEPKFGRS